jgi:hypothetical protein
VTLTIHLPPEVENRLRAEAARRGQDAAEYASALLAEILVPATARTPHPAINQEEWEYAFDAWIRSHHDLTAPVIPMESLRREHLYEDRGG